MTPTQQQNPDGSWSPAVPLGWQGSGIDWEIYTRDDGYEAHGFDEDVLVAKLRSRSRFLLSWKLHRWHKKHPDMPPNREAP